MTGIKQTNSEHKIVHEQVENISEKISKCEIKHFKKYSIKF